MIDPSEKDMEFLESLRNRPDKDPNKEFVAQLQRRLIQPTRKKRFALVPITITSFTLITFLAVTFLFFNQPSSENPLVFDNTETMDKTKSKENLSEDEIPIADQEEARILLEIPYGEARSEIGMPEKRPGGSDRTTESFFVKDNVFYVLDNAARKIVVTQVNGYLYTIQLNDTEKAEWYRDIFVDDDNNVYVLDSTNRKVIMYNKDGELKEQYPILTDMLNPTSLFVNEQKEIIVRDARPLMENLMTGETIKFPHSFEQDDIIVDVLHKNMETEEISIQEDGSVKKITVSFDHTTGGIKMLDIRSNQLIFEKTEVADTHKIMAEFHVYVINKDGTVLGAVREPHEQAAYYSSHTLRMEDKKIYYLSAGANSVVIYELIPGKQFEKKLQDRIDAFLNE
ncbi:NHL repeat-containing protein [Sporosarcina sp. ITBMC105]